MPPTATPDDIVANEQTDRPVALTVAGSDSGGGAGIQADLKTFEARGVFGTSAITAVTAQNTTGVTASDPLDTATVREQICAVTADFPVGAVKTGMLATPPVVEAVTETFDEVGIGTPGETAQSHRIPLVVDPVMVAEAGDPLLAEDAIALVRERLVPRATLLTPNISEAELLADRTIEDVADATAAAHELVGMGARAALVTGGHLPDPVDVLVESTPQGATDGRSVTRFEHPRIDGEATHGTGCTVSAAITADLASGARLPDAVDDGITFVTRAIRFGYGYGDGAGPVNHLAALRTQADVTRCCRAVQQAAATLTKPSFAPLVPEVGMNVAVAPRYATTPSEVVAIDGRLHRTQSGVQATGGVAPGASSHIARFLLGIRETDPSVAAACNVRHAEDTRQIVRELWDVECIDREEEPAHISGTMDWAAREAMSDRTRAPDAVLDDGAIGKEAMIRVVAATPRDLVEKLESLRSSLEFDADVVQSLVVDGEVDEQRRE